METDCVNLRYDLIFKIYIPFHGDGESMHQL